MERSLESEAQQPEGFVYLGLTMVGTCRSMLNRRRNCIYTASISISCAEYFRIQSA